MRTNATLHDGRTLEIEVTGNGPPLLIPANPVPIEGDQAESMREWGADPALGRHLIDGLADVAQVVAFDYEGHVLAHPKPRTLTPSNVIADVLAVADAAGVDRFAWYGYSWLAMIGLQLALATDRLTGLAMGGYPPIDGPYREMLQVTTAGYELATGARTSGGEDEWAFAFLPPDQSQQFVTLYTALQDFDDLAVQSRISVSRLCLVGSKDAIQYGPTWGDVLVDLARPVIERRAELESLGWEVHLLHGLDHTQAMQADRVVPILRPWLGRLGEWSRPAPRGRPVDDQPGGVMPRL
jgi:pimeloyl-ACP methyl ester carboxylesterase